MSEVPLYREYPQRGALCERKNPVATQHSDITFSCMASWHQYTFVFANLINLAYPQYSSLPPTVRPVGFQF